jgi:hypothetical protein
MGGALFCNLNEGNIMPKVVRTVETYPGTSVYRERYLTLPFNEVTRAEKTKYIAGKIALGGLLAGVIWGLGAPGETASEAELMSNARSQVLPTFEHMSDKARFEAQYLNPVYVEPTNRDSFNSRGLWGAVNNASPLTLRVGQNCLAGSAFDTRPKDVYRGNPVSGVAAVTYEDGLVMVHPAGNGSTALEFKSEGGILKPTDNTINSLRVNSCNVDPGVPVYSDDSDATYAPTDLGNKFVAQAPFLP